MAKKKNKKKNNQIKNTPPKNIQEKENRSVEITNKEGISEIEKTKKPEIIVPEKISNKETEMIETKENTDNQEIIKPEKTKLNKKAIIFIGILFFSIIFIIFSINAIGLFIKRNSEFELPVVYLTDGKVKFTNSRKRQATTLGSDESALSFDDITYSNKNDKYILYSLNNNLYMANTRTKKESEKIASNVKCFEFSEDDTYILYLTNNNELYSHNNKNTVKLDTDVTLIIETSNDTVFYKKEGNLFAQNFKKNSKEKIKIAADYATATLNNDKTKILYSKETENETYEYHVYNLKTKKDEKVLTNVYLLYDFNDDFTEFIYSTSNNKISINLKDYIEDDKQADDSNFTTYTFDDYWSNKIDYETYKNNQKESNIVESRNNIRKSLENENDSKYEISSSLDIYYQKKSKNSKIAENVKKVSYVSLSNQRLIYTKDDYSSIEKIKISDVNSLTDIKNHIKNNLKNSVMYKSLDTEETEITSGKKTVLATINKNELYCEADQEIYYAKIDKNKLTNLNKIADNTEVVEWDNYYKDGLVILSNIKDSKGELKYIKNGAVSPLDNDVYNDNLKVTDNRIYYYKNYKNNNGDYYYYDKKPKKIMSDISLVFYLEDNYMYVLKDYNTKNSTYDLYRYKNSKLELIDYDVKDINLSLK